MACVLDQEIRKRRRALLLSHSQKSQRTAGDHQESEAQEMVREEQRRRSHYDAMRETLREKRITRSRKQ
jgi:hypothetical protein